MRKRQRLDINTDVGQQDACTVIALEAGFVMGFAEAHKEQIMRVAGEPLQAADQAAREAVWSSFSTGSQL